LYHPSLFFCLNFAVPHHILTKGLGITFAKVKPHHHLVYQKRSIPEILYPRIPFHISMAIKKTTVKRIIRKTTSKKRIQPNAITKRRCIYFSDKLLR